VKWTIAVLTVPERRHEYARLMNTLTPQIQARSDIELMTCNMPGTVAEKRQWCLDNASGEYFNFIDDDDMVAGNYVDAIYPLLDGVDYIGFQLQLYIDGARQKPTYHSLEYDEWSDDANGYYRNVSHLNPIRTEIARQGRFNGGYGEDKRWADQVSPKTEHYIDQTLYHYFFSPGNSLTYGR
jgi:hypothetical protein